QLALALGHGRCRQSQNQRHKDISFHTARVPHVKDTNNHNKTGTDPPSGSQAHRKRSNTRLTNRRPFGRLKSSWLAIDRKNQRNDIPSTSPAAGRAMHVWREYSRSRIRPGAARARVMA